MYIFLDKNDNSPFYSFPERGKEIMKRNHLIIASVVGSVIIGIICISLGITCKQHRSEKLRRQSALRQDERRAIETEMATLLNGSPRSGHLRADGHEGAAQGAAGGGPRANGVAAGGALNSSYYLNPHIGQRLNHEKGGAPQSSMQYHEVFDTKAQVYNDANTPNGYCANGYESRSKCSNNRGNYSKLPLQNNTPKFNQRASPRPDVIQETCGTAKGIAPNARPNNKFGYDDNSGYLQTRHHDNLKQSPALPYDRQGRNATYDEIESRHHPLAYQGGHRTISGRKSADDLASHSQQPHPGNHGYKTPKTPPNPSTRFDFPTPPGRGPSSSSSSYQTMPIKRQRSLGSFLDTCPYPSETNMNGSRDSALNAYTGQTGGVRSKYTSRKSMSVDESEGARPKRTHSMDTKRAPILPDRRGPPQGQPQRDPSPDMFYTRPRKTEVRHAMV